MNLRFFLLIIFFIHGLITIYVCGQKGIFSPFPPFDSLVSYQVFSDLVASLVLVLIFLFVETKNKGLSLKPFWACIIGTILLGSFSPILYLLFRKKLFSNQTV